MQAVNVIFVPVPMPVPCAGVTHWRNPPTPQYPRERERGRWPLNPVPPVRDLRAVRALIADGKRLIAERRASRLLHELNGG
ncbi:MAG TPA: hypothetical protein VFE60_24510 [Roseiarcus sp.]|jgi:hypothetical protein|nr:hypothetical protein [Roseiarcus sp.]